MFATATRNFVDEVDPGGSLIPVSSLNDTIALLTVVVKKKRFWFWQKPKYIPTDFTINDILTGDTPLQPNITELDFITYNGTYGDNLKGTFEMNFVQNNVNVESKDTSKLQSSFGSLKKEELDVQKLLTDSKDRILDMSHCLIEQTKVKPRAVFGIVKERIVTTQPCSVIEEVQKEGQCGGILTSCGPASPKVSLKENGSLSKDSNVTMEIPIHTTLAYALIELEVKHDGYFKLCLMLGTTGGFEEVDGLCVTKAPTQSEINLLGKELEQLNENFLVLSALPAQTKSSLLQQIKNIISDRAAVSSLQNTLDQMCCNEHPASDEFKDESHKQLIQTILDSGNAANSVTRALHLILSAVDEMPDDCVDLFGKCCHPMLLLDLELVVQCIMGSGELPLSTMRQTTLAEDVYKIIEHLFGSSKVLLNKSEDTLRTEILQGTGHLPLILCIAVRGLASLVQL